MSIPLLNCSEDILEMRRYENQLDRVQSAIDDFVLDPGCTPKAVDILKYIQDSLTKRLWFVDRSSSEYKDIQSEITQINGAINKMEATVYMDRADRRIKQVLANMQVVL